MQRYERPNVIVKHIARQGLFGERREGWNAALVLFDEDPLEDISVIETPERAIALVMQSGYIVRDNRQDR